MSKLKNLNLTANQIAYIKQDSFVDLVLLETLRLGNDKLTNLTNNMFNGLSNLTVLVLSYNKIQYIHKSVFQCLTSSQTLHILKIQLQHITEILPIFHLPQLLRLKSRDVHFKSAETC